MNLQVYLITAMSVRLLATKPPVAAAELNGKVAQVSDVVRVVAVGGQAYNAKLVRSCPLGANRLVHLRSV